MYTAITYPGQSEAVRIGTGRIAWVVDEKSATPRSTSMTWRDEPYQPATHTPAQFLAAYPPRPGGVVERQARARGIKLIKAPQKPRERRRK